MEPNGTSDVPSASDTAARAGSSGASVRKRDRRSAAAPKQKQTASRKPAKAAASESRRLERIIGVTKDGRDKVRFVVLFHGSSNPELMTYKRVRKNHQKLLLQFYEDNLVFEDK